MYGCYVFESEHGSCRQTEEVCGYGPQQINSNSTMGLCTVLLAMLGLTGRSS
jgi:hypothetical protein